MTLETEGMAVFEPSLDHPITLKREGGLSETRHQFEEKDVWAVQAALAIKRPLLIRGEPGTGKSQLARAAAAVLQRPFLYEVITANTEITDLLWHYDAVGRLGEAQMQSAGGNTDADAVKESLAAGNFISPGKIWWALDWPGAQKQAKKSHTPVQGSDDKEWQNGCVLLIDEIDKADSELPNTLLECFANSSFHVPQRPEAISGNPDQRAPLVVITTNEERELPAAFLRRCLVHHLDLPKNDDKLRDLLVSRGRVHYQERYSGVVADYETVLHQAAELVIEDRRGNAAGISKPGQAEYLDLCQAVFEIATNRKLTGCEILSRVKSYSLKKNAE